MPELPEVETVCRGLAAKIQGLTVQRVTVRRPDLRFPLPADFAVRLTGRRVESIGRRAKYMLWHLDDGTVAVGHLGMSGRMLILDRPNAPPGKHDHLVFELDHGVQVRFNDARRFGYFSLTDAAGLAAHPHLVALGPEPLGAAFDAAYLGDRLAGKQTSIKAALLDQRVVAGLGNIYVCEALYHAGIAPTRPAGLVEPAQIAGLVAAIRRVLREAIAAGGSTLRDYVQASGELGYFQHGFAVYARAGLPCPGCAAVARACAVQRITQQGRSSFYCSTRQS